MQPRNSNHPTKAIAILICLKSVGVLHNTFANFDFISSYSLDKKQYIVSYTNGAKNHIRLSADINNRGKLDLDTLTVLVDKVPVDLSKLKTITGIKDFKELKLLERVSAGKDITPIKLMRDFILATYIQFTKEQYEEKLIADTEAPLLDKIAELEKTIQELTQKLEQSESNFKFLSEDMDKLIKSTSSQQQ